MREALKRRLQDSPAAYGLARGLARLGRDAGRWVAGRPGARNLLACRLSAFLGLGRSLGRPILLNVEPSSACNLGCPVCETGARVLGRPAALMSPEDFATVLGRFGPELRRMLFYFMGEPFLNRGAYAMIRQAADRGVAVSACTNGEALDPAALVGSGLAEVQFQIGGVTPDSHRTYRVGGDLEKTLAKLRETLRLRGLRRLRPEREAFPLKVGLGLIVMRHNEAEVDDFVSLASSLGVDSWEVIPPCVRTVEQAREMLPRNPAWRIYDEAALAEGRLRPKRPLSGACEWLYAAVTVLVNGDVVPCCRDPLGRMVLGNLLRQPLEEVWNGPAFREVRRRVAGGRAPELCALCEGYASPEPW